MIVSDSTHPKSGDSWVLYTQEFYRLVREHLTDDGVFVEWVPTHELRTAEFKIIVRTFQSVFPHASLWITHGIDEQGRSGTYSLLAATPGPLKIDVAKLRDRLNAEAVRRDLEPFGLHTPAGFLDTFLCAEEALRHWAGEGPVNTDDLPYTQYETRYSTGAMLNNCELHRADGGHLALPDGHGLRAGGKRAAKSLLSETKSIAWLCRAGWRRHTLCCRMTCDTGRCVISTSRCRVTLRLLGYILEQSAGVEISGPSQKHRAGRGL